MKAQLPLVAFLPLRKGSERVTHKNTKPFSASGQSLFQIKLTQLLRLEALDGIVVSSNDEEVFEQASEMRDSRLILDHRPEALCISSTRVSDLTKYAAQVCRSEMILWTHATSPFFGERQYKQVIQELGSSKRHDSLGTVTALREFILDETYAPRFEFDAWRNWPRTQDLKPHFHFNFAAFLAPRKVFESGARLGHSPLFFECDKLDALDIDTEGDWGLAQALHQKRPLE